MIKRIYCLFDNNNPDDDDYNVDDDKNNEDGELWEKFTSHWCFCSWDVDCPLTFARSRDPPGICLQVLTMHWWHNFLAQACLIIHIQQYHCWHPPATQISWTLLSHPFDPVSNIEGLGHCCHQYPHCPHHGRHQHHHRHHHHPQHEYHHHRHLFTGELVEIVLLPHHHIFALDLNPIVPEGDAFDFYLNVVDVIVVQSGCNLSGRVCSCQKPTTCPSSWTTIPNLSQFFPIEIAWKWKKINLRSWLWWLFPPFHHQQQQQDHNQSNNNDNTTTNNKTLFIITWGPFPLLPTKEQQPQGLSVNTIQFGCSEVRSTNWQIMVVVMVTIMQ